MQGPLKEEDLMPAIEQRFNEATDKTDRFSDLFSIFGNQLSAMQTYWKGLSGYTNDFFIPYLLATQYFQRVEVKRLLEETPAENIQAYLGLLENNLALMTRSLNGTAVMMESYTENEADELTEALRQTFFELNPTKLSQFTARQAKLLDLVVNVYPKAIAAIEPEYGFHFERGEHVLADETDRFLLYRIAPSIPNVDLQENAKPILILPPYVLGANILGFLPGEQRSYAHCYANRGVPTYIRILKDIESSPALQVMTGEDDARDTRRFCETLYLSLIHI